MRARISADSANASVVLLGGLLEILLDPEIPDPQVRQAVWQRATPEQLQLALDLAGEIDDAGVCDAAAAAPASLAVHVERRRRG